MRQVMNPLHSEVTLDEASHTYRDISGRIVPSVTGILAAAGIIETEWFSDYARIRGLAVHKAIELLERGTLDPDSISDGVAPYLESWKNFKKDTDYQCRGTELKIYHKRYRYAGTIDQIGEVFYATCLLDIKTGVEQHWWALQTAAYNEIAKCKHRFSLQLKSDGKYRLIEHTNKRDFQVFLACLTVAGWKKQIGQGGNA